MRSSQQTETGDTRIYGVTIGVVVQNYNAQMPGRVCVNIPTRDAQTNQLKWARQAVPSSGTGWGYYFVPEIGDQVLLAFEGGNIEKPYIIGCVPRDNSMLLSRAADPLNQNKRIVTKHGSMISFGDNAEGEGTLDKISIETAGGGHVVELNNETGSITLSNKEQTNRIEMKTREGMMTIKAGTNLTIEVGEQIRVIMNGESGTVQIQAGTVSVNATEQVKASAGGMLKLDGAQVSVTGSSVLKAESGGMVSISGNPITIG